MRRRRLVVAGADCRGRGLISGCCLWLIEGTRLGRRHLARPVPAGDGGGHRLVAPLCGRSDGHEGLGRARVFAVAIQIATALVMGLLVMATGHDNTGWMFYGALSLLMLAIARFQPENEWAVAFTAAMAR